MAHLQTRLNIGATGSSQVSSLDFYDIRELRDHMPKAFQSVEAIRQQLVMDGVSFTSDRTGTVVLGVALTLSQEAVLIEIDPRREGLYNIR